MITPWNTVKKERIFTRPHVKVEHWTIDVGEEERSFDICLNDNVVMVCGITENNEILLLEQYFVGPEQVVYSTVAGCIEKGEDIEEAAKRELMEEAGCEAKELIPLGSVWKNKWETGKIHYYLATGIKKVADITLEQGENLEPVFVSIDQCKAFMQENKIHDNDGLLCVYKAGVHLKFL